MSKQKTHSAAKKRFTVTATGRVKHKQAHKSHLLSHESSKRKRALRGTKMVHKSNEKQVKLLMPYA